MSKEESIRFKIVIENAEEMQRYIDSLRTAADNLQKGIESINQDFSAFVTKFSESVRPALQASIDEASKAEPSPEPKEKKRRKHRQQTVFSKSWPDPVKLIEQGWVARGPYSNGKGGQYKALRLVNPKNMREYHGYPIGENGISQERADELIKLAKVNNRLVGPRGGQQKKPSAMPAPPPPKPEPAKNDGCAICTDSTVALGTCRSMDAPHCMACCDKHNHQVD